jgi:hypothetical protein
MVVVPHVDTTCGGGVLGALFRTSTWPSRNPRRTHPSRAILICDCSRIPAMRDHAKVFSFGELGCLRQGSSCARAKESVFWRIATRSTAGCPVKFGFVHWQVSPNREATQALQVPARACGIRAVCQTVHGGFGRAFCLGLSHPRQ